MLRAVNSWTRIADRTLRTLHLNSMSGKFLLVAVVATLFTGIVMWVALPRGEDRSDERLAMELRGVSSEAARAMGAWLDERVFDLRLRASPYVVSDTAGNSWDLVSGPQGEPWMRGGSWYHQAIDANASNHSSGEASQRNVRIGYRVCADAEPAR